MRRPLATAALFFVLLVRLLTWIWPLPVQAFDFEDGQTAEFEGEVTDVTQYTDSETGRETTLITIKNSVLISSVKNNSNISQQPQFTILCKPQEGEPLPEIGSRVRYFGEISFFSCASNPGEFDSREYYSRQGVDFSLKKAELTGKSREYSRIRQNLFLLKNRLAEALDTFLQAREASVVKAMLLGEKKGMDQEVKELYQRAGISHVLAISGLHISLLGMGVYRLLAGFCGKKISGLCSSLFLLAYLCMAGFSASSLRAGIMFLLGMLARMTGRTYDAPTALAVAAALLLAENPALIGDSGFQLSFLAAVGAVLVIPRFAGEVSAPRSGAGLRIWREIRGGFLSSFCISMVTLPVVLKNFYEWNVLSVFINIVVIPLMGTLLGCCIILAVAGALLLAIAGPVVLEWPPVFQLCLTPVSLTVRAILYLYEKLCLLGNSLPFGMIRTGEPQLWQTVVYCAGFAVILFYPELRKKMGAGQKRNSPATTFILKNSVLIKIVAMLLLSTVFLINPTGEVQLTMLDVGQGECIYLETETGHDYLYDGGSTSKSSTGKWQIIPFLKQQGVRKLELIFLSHWDEDHVNGILEVLEWAGEGNLQIGGLVLSAAGPEDEMYEKLKSAAQAAQVLIYRMSAGDVIRDGECTFVAVYPQTEVYQTTAQTTVNSNTAFSSVAETDRNNSSLVLRFSRTEQGQETFSILLTGDVEASGEAQMIRETQVASLILDVPHHGSSTSSSGIFLDAVSPHIALISCGKNNSYGHPSKEVVQRLLDRGIRIYETTQTGAVTITQRGSRIGVECYGR